MHVDELFANHLLFMANHRGSVRLEGRNVHIDGPAPELVSFVPGGVEADIPDQCPAVRLAPWANGVVWDNRLEAAGFLRAESLVYMELANPNARLPASASIGVVIAEDERLARVFAAIQAAGFETDDWWTHYLLDQARRNYDHPAQRFYLGSIDGTSVTSTLALRSPSLTGIYAVATLPAYRNRGVSAAVLDRVRADAIRSGFPRLILQAMSGSYAERYYAKLGFLARFVSQVWRRSAAGTESPSITS